MCLCFFPNSFEMARPIEFQFLEKTSLWFDDDLHNSRSINPFARKKAYILKGLKIIEDWGNKGVNIY